MFTPHALCRYPDALINATHSTIYTGQYLESQSLDKGLVEDVLRTHLGIIDPSEHEINDLLRTKDAYHFDRILSTMVLVSLPFAFMCKPILKLHFVRCTDTDFQACPAWMVDTRT